MICPRCTTGEIPDGALQCTVCGFTPGANVVLDEPPVDEVLEGIQKSLGKRFDVQVLLKVGERSFVYLARELGQRDRLVVLKVIPVAGGVGRDLAQRFAYRANQVMRVQHSNTVPLYDYGSVRSFLWYTMPHLLDPTLAESLRRRGPMDPESCSILLRHVAEGLEQAHRQGVVHGHLKPQNIFVSPQWLARVGDFAGLEPSRLPGRYRAMPLHPEYMAPEQLHGHELDASADQYSLGVIAYQCLTGTLPFVGDSWEEIARLQMSEPAPLVTALRPAVPSAMTDAIRRAMGRTSAERFPAIRDFAAALSPTLAARDSGRQRGRGAARSSPSHLLLIDQPTPPSRLRTALLAGIALALVGAGALWWRRDDLPWRSRPPSGRLILRAEDLVARDREPGAAALHRDQPAAPASRPPAPAAARTTPFASAPVRSVTEFGRLFVNATPWGALYVDDVLVGNTPKADLPLPAGTHVVRVVRDGFTPFERRVQLAAGEVLRLTDIVLTPRQ